MTELEEKYLVQEQPISQFQGIRQPHHVHIPIENMNLQSVSTNQASPSTSVYSESILNKPKAFSVTLRARLNL